MAASPELKGFIDHRGTPQALEVETSFFSPTTLTLYYPEAAEGFSLESSDTTWIIEGPFTLEESKRQELARLSRDPARLRADGSLESRGTEGKGNTSLPESGNHVGSAVPQDTNSARTGFESGPFANQGSEGTDSLKAAASAESDPFLGRLEEAYRLKGKKSESQGFSSPSDGTKQHEALSRALQEGEPSDSKISLDASQVPSSGNLQAPLAKNPEPLPFKPAFLPTREDPLKETASSSTTPATGTSAKPETARGSEEEQFLRALAEKESTNKAELTPKGDLVHYVTLQGETLSNIARWYTFDRENAKRLARINELKNPDQLSLGDIVIIPSYLVKNQRRLTESGLAAIQDRVQKMPTRAPSQGH
jgi:hypothetical protein